MGYNTINVQRYHLHELCKECIEFINRQEVVLSPYTDLFKQNKLIFLLYKIDYTISLDCNKE